MNPKSELSPAPFKVHRMQLFRPHPLQNTLTLEAKAICPLPCAVQDYRLAGNDGRCVTASIIWENKPRGVASMAFLPPDAPEWAEKALVRLVKDVGENSPYAST
jgi:hypothetical protein